jgi:hypothetical protein
MNIEELAHGLHSIQDLMKRAQDKKVRLALEDLSEKHIEVLSAHNDYALIRTIVPAGLDGQSDVLALPYSSHVGYKIAE